MIEHLCCAIARNNSYNAIIDPWLSAETDDTECGDVLRQYAASYNRRFTTMAHGHFYTENLAVYVEKRDHKGLGFSSGGSHLLHGAYNDKT